jgi:NADH-quinone oxidoreductase subunit N
MNLGAFAVCSRSAAEALRGRSTTWPAVAWRQPLLGVAMTIFILSLAGIPPTAGFAGSCAVQRRDRRGLRPASS